MTEQERMRIAVIGSNTFSDYGRMKGILDPFIAIHNNKEVSLVFGGIDNIDELAKKYSDETGVPIKRTRAKELAKGADRIIAFWDGEQDDTVDIMNKATQLGIPPYVVNFRRLDK